MSIEEIKKRHEESIKDGEFRIFAADIEFLLEQNQRLAEEIEYVKLDRKTYMDRGLEKRRLIVKQEKQIESLQKENQRLVEALELAEKHISGKAEKFSEREKIPVLYQINEALQAYKLLETKD